MADRSTEKTLHCWACEHWTGGDSPVLAHGGNVSLVKAGQCHLTVSEACFAERTYIRDHPDHMSHHIKPYRIYCKTCKNQLGVVSLINGKLRPSLNQNSIIFKDSMNKEIQAFEWKAQYAKETHFVPIENLGPAVTRDPGVPSFYILNHKMWSDNKPSEVRLQSDRSKEEPQQWSLAKDGKSFETLNRDSKSPPESPQQMTLDEYLTKNPVKREGSFFASDDFFAVWDK